MLIMNLYWKLFQKMKKRIYPERYSLSSITTDIDICLQRSFLKHYPEDATAFQTVKDTTACFLMTDKQFSYLLSK